MSSLSRRLLYIAPPFANVTTFAAMNAPLYLALFACFTLWACTLNAEERQSASEKHIEDPTQIVTRAGVGYDGELTVNASIGLDDSRMLRGKVNASGDDWYLGGSWLFEKGIVNLYVDGNTDRISYNLGTYVPLSEFGVNTGKWMVFPTGGVSVIDPKNTSELNYGGYLGGFAIRPFNEQWSLVSWLGTTVASNNYQSIWGGIGASYRINREQSIRGNVNLSNDDYGHNTTSSISYTYQF
ncbi:hypothetical protein AHAT_07390 [Agarivorans sp. Toyoura001]|uniref:hypothetical protein n=1 Tax=Agarivorans sp. Toyoura001 TaxID=2283141 RepID=UPI0010D0517D|nr:hypothetical protein [Agarivorans sp. Toyoura001]GDY24849.1 hypothetical protein AHAT_07390 [Agarivorans sp. Toyoura001]